MDMLHSLGYVAGCCSTLAFVPQIWRTCHTRHARDISYGLLLLLISGALLWLVYGLVISDLPVILANVVTLLLLLFLTTLKSRFG